MNLGILFGGNSLEHEISIVSAYGLKKKLEKNYKITMIYINHKNEVYNANKLTLDDFKYNKFKKLRKTQFLNHGIKKAKLDCCILCLHGENSEDGLGAALCRFYHIPFVGSDILASSIGMDKYVSYLYLSKNGVPMLDSSLYSYEDYLQNKKIDTFPCIIKPLYGGSSIGIYVCNNEEEFNENIVKAFAFGNKFIIQPYFSDLVEYNLAVYDEGFSKLEKIEKKDVIFSFDDKYNESFKLMHQSLKDNSRYEEFSEIAKRVYDLLKCKGIIRIDFFMIKDLIYVNEVNILPGALAMYLFDDFNKVIMHCIKKAITEKEIVYKRGTFLAKSNINK